jgi:hypothetical protein
MCAVADVFMLLVRVQQLQGPCTWLQLSCHLGPGQAAPLLVLLEAVGYICGARA